MLCRRFNALSLLLILTLAGCSSRVTEPPNPRLAIVTFDNQSNDKDQWIASLLSVAAVYQLGGESALAASHAEDSEGWRQLGVGRIISGYYYRAPNGLHIVARLTKTSNTELIRQVEQISTDQDLPAASAKILTELLGVKPVELKGSSTAWNEFAKALSARRLEDLEAFQKASPSFAPAYPVLARLLVQVNRRDEAERLQQQFPPDGDDLSATQLKLLLSKDIPSRIGALEKLVQLRGGDPNPRAELGRVASDTGQWKLAAQQFQELAKMEPQKQEWWNLLGYAEAQLNHVPEAVEALNHYRRLSPNDPNAIDSLGEVHYMNRQFKVAAGYFDEQVMKYPAFHNGAGLRKSAFAHYFGGDLRTADQRFEQWLKQSLGSADPGTQVFQRAMWLARTNRTEQGLEMMKVEEQSSTGERKALAELRTAMMRFGLVGLRPSAELLRRLSSELKQGEPRNELTVFALLAQPSPSEAALKAKIEAAMPQPELLQFKNQLLEAASALHHPEPQVKTKVFPLPNAIDTALDAVLLRSRLAVIP